VRIASGAKQTDGFDRYVVGIRKPE
jgi:hypothetical protein